MKTDGGTMTNREYVLSVYPKAVSYLDMSGHISIKSTGSWTAARVLGSGKTESEAWSCAANRIKAERWKQ